MRNSHRGAGLLGMAVVVLAISGCQGPSGAFEIPGLDPSGNPTEGSGLPTPIPTATGVEVPELEPVVDEADAHYGPTGAAPATAPVDRIHSTCGDLFADPRSATFLGGTPVLTTATPISSPEDAALRQAGVIRCYSTYTSGSKQGFMNWMAGPADSTLGGYAVPNYPGFYSYGCAGGSAPSSCTLYAQRSGYAIDSYTRTYTSSSGFDTSVMSTEYQAIASSVLDTLSAGGPPRAVWTATETGRVTGCEGFDAGGAVRDGFDVSGSAYRVWATDSGYYSYLGEATYRQGWQECKWDSPADPAFSIQYAPGSSWAWSSLDRSGLSAVSVAGAREAYGACTASQCVLHVLASQTWIMATSDATTSGVARLAAGVGAFIPLMPLDEA